MLTLRYLKYVPIILITAAVTLHFLPAAAQSDYYFPPNTGTWETVSPEELGWCADEIPELLELLEERNTKAFILMHKGRIVIEAYFDDFGESSSWVWNSAGKTMTAFAVGLAQQEGLLNINDPTSQYLGEGWTSLTPEQEAEITIWHQLTMTSGLDDGVNDPFCTDPECLEFLAEPGTRWAYHNGPYTPLTSVVAEASGQGINQFVNARLGAIGMSGLYLPFGFNNVFASTARSMARFGHLILAQGVWNGNTIMSDTEYFNAMITPSQSLNESYGYLWWLNGQDSYQVPGFEFSFPGNFIPNAPDDCVAAIGLNAQIINVVPSKDLVFIRMGEDPDGGFVPFLFNDEIWEKLNVVLCNDTFIDEQTQAAAGVYPNPAGEAATLFGLAGRMVKLVNAASGQEIRTFRVNSDREVLQTNDLARGMYLLLPADGGGQFTPIRFIR